MESNNSAREAKLMEMLGHCQGKLSEITTVLERLCSEVNELRKDIDDDKEQNKEDRED